jgi:hypothetical protein
MLQRLKSGELDPSTIDLGSRRLLVSHLMGEGYATAEMAQLMKVSDRSIERDKHAIREENALPQDPKLTAQMTGRLVGEAELTVQRIRRIARDKLAPPSVRIDGEYRCYQILSDLVQRLQGLGYLPTAAHRVEADLVHHAGEPPELDELSVEVQRIRELSEQSGGESPPELAEIEGKIERVRIASDVEQLAHRPHPQK